MKVYLTNNYGLHYGYEYEILGQVMQQPTCNGGAKKSLLL